MNLKYLDDVRRCEYFKFFSCAFHGVMAPKRNCLYNTPKMRRLEMEILKILISTYFLPKLLMKILQFLTIRRISKIKP